MIATDRTHLNLHITRSSQELKILLHSNGSSWSSERKLVRIDNSVVGRYTVGSKRTRIRYIGSSTRITYYCTLMILTWPIDDNDNNRLQYMEVSNLKNFAARE